MAQQGLAHGRVGGARIGLLPIEHHPFVHEAAVQRTGAAEHEVDARCFVEEVGPVQIAAHLRFQPPDEARQQGAFEGVPVDGAPGGGELGVLRQAEAEPRAGGFSGVVGAARQGAGLVKQRRQARQVGVGHGVERQ